MALTPVRRMIADAMARSVREIPHAWSMVEVDVSELVDLRNRERDGFRQREGVNLTYLPFALKAVAGALKDNPTLNASWGDDHIVLKRRVHLGIAGGRAKRVGVCPSSTTPTGSASPGWPTPLIICRVAPGTAACAWRMCRAARSR